MHLHLGPECAIMIKSNMLISFAQLLKGDTRRERPSCRCAVPSSRFPGRFGEYGNGTEAVPYNAVLRGCVNRISIQSNYHSHPKGEIL